MAKPRTRSFTGPDGTNWKVAVQAPGSSNAMIVFRNPYIRTTRLDRYAWFITSGPEANDVTARLNKKTVLDGLADADFARLFRRSMPVSTARASSVPVHGGGSIVE
jgi:hypothetical protein